MKKIILIALASLTMVGCYKDDNSNGKCSSSHQCGLPTNNNDPCKHVVTDGHQHCWQHR